MEKYKVTSEREQSAYDVMSSLIGNVIKLDIDEIEGYEFPLDEPFGLLIPYNNELYSFIIKFSSKNKNLICMGPGARNRDQVDKNGNVMKPPFFVRWSWHEYFDESVIAYADPVMDHMDDIAITWFVGDDEHWPLQDIALIFEKLTANQNILHENILFYGSSGGGFSAFVLGTLIKNSHILVNNPQFFVLNYGKQFVDKLFELLKIEFNGLSREEIIEKIAYRIDAIELFKRENYIPPMTYYLNSKSKIDMKLQFPKLTEAYFDLENVNPFKIIMYEDPEIERPHNPLPNKDTIDIIKLFCKNHMYNTGDESKGSEIISKGHYDDSIINGEFNSKAKELAAIKSSKTYMLWRKYLKFKSKF